MALAVEKTAQENADIYFGEWTSIRINDNTWLNYTNVYIREGEGFEEFLFIYYVKYVSETHRLYVIALAKRGDGQYDHIVAWAGLKTNNFGDWVVAKDVTLSQFFDRATDAIDRLKRAWDSSDRQYKPQAYPQIAQSLREIARTIGGTSIDLPVRNATMLVTDVNVKVAFAVGLAVGVTYGVYYTLKVYSRTGDFRRAAACGFWYGVNMFWATSIGLIVPWYGVIRGFLTTVAGDVLGC